MTTAIWKDYWQLCKPRVVALILLTALAGMLLASPVLPSPLLLLVAFLGIGLCSASAAVVNHLLDRYLDAKMNRTKGRPMAQKRLKPVNVILFALVLAVCGFLALFVYVNPLTAFLTLAALLGYAFVYTGYLKWVTPQNIVLGGLSGAMPPLLGWTSVTGHIDAYPLILVAIIFVWTPPHFWALAMQKKDDYAAGNVPMLPVTHGLSLTRLHVSLYAMLTILFSLFPYILGYCGIAYLFGVLPLNAWWAYRVWRLWFPRHNREAYILFRHSINYLAILFLLLLADHWVNY